VKPVAPYLSKAQLVALDAIREAFGVELEAHQLLALDQGIKAPTWWRWAIERRESDLRPWAAIVAAAEIEDREVTALRRFEGRAAHPEQEINCRCTLVAITGAAVHTPECPAVDPQGLNACRCGCHTTNSGPTGPDCCARARGEVGEVLARARWSSRP